MITMDIGLFGITLLIFFLGGGAVGWLLRGLRKDECSCDSCCDSISSNSLQEAIQDVIRKDLAQRGSAND